MLWFLVPLVVFLGMMVMLAGRLGKPTDIVSNTAKGRLLPAFSLPLLSDPNRVMVKEDLPKTPFLLNVWGSWCPTCRIEHPFLLALKEQGVPMVGVNYKDETKEALAYLNEHQDPFLYSIKDAEGSLAVDLGLTGAPETFVVAGDGKVWQHLAGELDEAQWARLKPCWQALAGNDEAAKVRACGDQK